MQITITEEYKGAIREPKPHGLFHASGEVKLEGGLTPEQVFELKTIIDSTDLVVLRDALENTILLDLYEKGSYAALLSEANEYLCQYPEADPVFRPHILFHVAEALYYQGQYPEAMLRYRELMTDYISSEIYSFANQGLAWCLMHLGRHDEARDEFKKLSPTTVDGFVAAFFGRAINEFNDEEYAEAIRLFFDETGYQQIPLEGIWGPLARALVPKNLYYKALAYDRLGDQRTAVQYFRRVAEDYPDHPKAGRATYLVGWLSFLSEDYDQAITYLNKALDRVSDSSDIYEIRTNLSQAYFNAGRLSEAVNNWKEIRRVWGPSVANVGLEQCYTRLSAEIIGGEYGFFPTDTLERLLKNFAADLPDSKDLPTFQFQLAQRFYDEKDYRKVLEWTAIAMASQATEDIIKDAKKLRLYSLYSLEEWKELVGEGENFKEQYPKDTEGNLLFVMGVGYASRGDDLRPTNVPLAHDHFRKAIPLFEQFLNTAPEENPYRSTAAQLLAYCRSQLQ
jgi:tetratricopeptide (TPR) repeat protein